MRRGHPLLCDELNLAPPEVIAFLAPLLDARRRFDCPFGSGSVAIAPGFVVIAAQNPPHYAGRGALPPSFVQRALHLEVPAYTEAEVVQIMTRRLRAGGLSCSAGEDLVPRLELLLRMLGYRDSGAPRAGPHHGVVSLRHVLKLLSRLCADNTWSEFGASSASRWADVLRLQANVLFPELVPPEYALERLAASLTVRGGTGVFGLEGAGQRCECRLPLVHDSGLAAAFPELPVSAQLLTCKLAFCVGFREPVLLSGPTCFKAHCVQLLGRSLRLERSGSVDTIYLSRLSETADLEGSIEPHSAQSYALYLDRCCRWLEQQATATGGAVAGVPPLARDCAPGLATATDLRARLVRSRRERAISRGTADATRAGASSSCASSMPSRPPRRAFLFASVACSRAYALAACSF